ncbi:MAG: serine/threonine-protein kinase [Verrucomicrobiales bacterium]|nr:serine/threonine-protein kinase [Verrucomicrobiales bacterium]
MAQPLKQFEQYTILGEIAGGGMGIVYQAVHRPLNRSCALKLIRGGLLATPDERRRFLTETEAASTLDHPGIVRVRRAGEFENQWFLEMDLVDGGTLADRLTEGRLPPDDAARLVERLARAVQHAHDHGVLHRDLKPANVLLDAVGEPKLTDFGLARFLGRDSDLTRTIAVLGTPAYMAPEIASGRARDATIAADIFSLGIILFECLTGDRPFKGRTPLEILRAVQETPTPRPSSLCPHLPRDLEVITLRCLAREPERRFASASELADELTRYLGGEPIRSRAVPPLERLWLWCRRNPPLAAAAGLLVLGAIGTAAGITWQWRRAESANATLANRLATEEVQKAAREYSEGKHTAAFLRVMQFIRDTPGPVLPRTWLHAHLANDSFLVPERDFPVQGETGFVTFDPVRRRIISAGQNGIHIFDRDHGNLLTHFESEAEVGLAWPSPTDDCVLSLIPGRFTRIWSLRLPDRPRLSWEATGVVQVAVSAARPHFAAVNSDGAIWVGPLDTSQTAVRLPDIPSVPVAISGNTNLSTCIVALPDGRILMKDSSSTAWRTLTTWHTNITHLALTSNQQFVVGGARQEVAVWRFADGQHQFARSLDTSSLLFGLSPDGNRAVAARADGRVQLLDLFAEPAKRQEVQLSPGFIALDFTPSGRHLVAINEDGTSCLLSVSPLQVVASARQPDFAWNADFDEASGLLVTSSSGGHARLFRLTPPATNTVALVRRGITAAAPWPGRRALALLSGEGSLLLSETDRASVVSRQAGSLSNSTSIAVADTCTPRAFVADAAGHIFSIPLDRQDQPRELLTLPTSIRLLTVSSDARRLAAAETNQIHLVHLSGDTAILRANWPFQNVRSLTFSSRGEHLAMGSNAGTVACVESASGQLLWSSQTHQGPVFGLAFSSDGTRLATASMDKTARVWDVRSGRELLPPLAQRAEAVSIAFNNAGTSLAVGSADEITLWDARTGRRVSQLSMPRDFVTQPSPVAAVAFSPNGSRVLGANGMGHLAVWDVATAYPLGDWSMSVPDRIATRTRAAWLDDSVVAAWSFSGVVRFFDFSRPLKTPLLLDLAEYVTGQQVTDGGAFVPLNETARAERLARLRIAAANGELTPSLARHLPDEK